MTKKRVYVSSCVCVSVRVCRVGVRVVCVLSCVCVCVCVCGVRGAGELVDAMHRACADVLKRAFGHKRMKAHALFGVTVVVQDRGVHGLGIEPRYSAWVPELRVCSSALGVRVKTRVRFGCVVTRVSE